MFVGADKVTGEIAALKRINTEAEENGFPITAIREVKILKALNHDNIVLLKEIVTSKGKSKVSCSCLEAISRRINLFVHFHRIPPLDVRHSSTRPNYSPRHYFGIAVHKSVFSKKYCATFHRSHK